MDQGLGTYLINSRYGMSPKADQAVADQLITQAKTQYPFLNNVNFAHNFDRANTGYLETWQPNDEGGKDYPRPKNLPTDKIGIELYNRTITPSDIAADYYSHGLPEGMQFAANLFNSLTPAQQKYVQNSSRDYASKLAEGQKLMNDPHYAYRTPEAVQQAANDVAAQGLARGVIFGQWPQQAINVIGLTSKQKQLINKEKERIHGK